MFLDSGTRLGSYRIVGPLGAGGMGEVYRARHEKLGRDVAIKVLSPALANDHAGLARFEREARTASSLNHPNIVTIYDIGEQGGTTYIAMELVEGRPLSDLIAEGPIEPDRALALAVQVADGLARAHGAGIVHRDIKPANVMVTEDSRAKVLDFGLARPTARSEGTWTGAVTPATGTGILAGTPHYMAPERWDGGDADHRSDQFAFGVLLYEMLAGRRPFEGPSATAVMAAMLTRPPPPLRGVRRGIPVDLERVVERCLEKKPDDRFRSTAELVEALRACVERRDRARYGIVARLRRPSVAAPMALLVLGLLGGGGVWVQGAERRWAEREAIGEIEGLVEQGEVYTAYRTALRASRHLGTDHPELSAVLGRITMELPVRTEPQGAEVAVKRYGSPDAPWEVVGTTPLTMTVPYALMRWRITLPGYEPFEGAPFSGSALGTLAQGLSLDPAGGRPADMVRVPAGALQSVIGLRPDGEGPLAVLDSYLLDRYEVTNRQYREFVDAGGYANPEWWPEELRRGGEDVAWVDAVVPFVDATGRPGPAHWELGHYPEGTDDHPVTGISWFEAAAYCAFVGRSLPTIYHWFYALGHRQRSEILSFSNIMGGEGTAPVGQHHGIASFGNYDMAGNAKEWAWNASGEMRYLLGGAWDDPGYLVVHPVAQDPWDRGPANGVRCASYPDGLPEALTGPVTPNRAYPLPDPVDARGFELIRGLYAYDDAPLEARVDAVADSLPGYRRESVSFETAYGEGRMQVHLYIPREVEPPYQSVIWFPGGDVYSLRTSDRLSSSYLVDFLPRTGRVLVQPVFAGMYERFEPLRWDSPAYLRDMLVRWVKDLGRTIDYLETRPDIDPDRIAYFGFSNGATFGPVFAALEPRLAASVLLGGGLIPERFRPEAHPATFAPWARTPTVLISGRDDFMMPFELSQRPFFEMLGAAPTDKRHVRLAGGHIPSDRREIIREVLNWLDERLGPVEERP